MSVDIKKAFTFPFKDKNWPQKIVIGGLILFLNVIINFVNQSVNPSKVDPGQVSSFGEAFSKGLIAGLTHQNSNPVLIAVIIIVSILISALIIGYILQSVHNEIKDETPLLPEWGNNTLTHFKRGLKITLATLLYFIPIVILSGIIVIILAFAGASRQAAMISAFSIILIFLLIYPFILTSYAENFKIIDIFNLGRIFNLIFRVISDYIVILFITIIVWILWFILHIVLTCTCIGAIIPPFLNLLMQLAIYNMFAQVYKQSLAKG